jgi:hypothetical protein
MGCGCNVYSGHNNQRTRGFLTEEEKFEILKEYQKDLERELQGVSERIKESDTKRFFILFFEYVVIKLNAIFDIHYIKLVIGPV